MRPASRRRGRRCRRRPDLLDGHGRSRPERRLHRARRPRREPSHGRCARGRNVHAQADAPRQEEPQDLLVGSRGDAGDAREPRRLRYRNLGGERPRRGRSTRPDPLVRRHHGRRGPREDLLDPEGAAQGRGGSHLPSERRHPQGRDRRQPERHRAVVRQPAGAHRSGARSRAPPALLDRSRGSSKRRHDQSRERRRRVRKSCSPI